MLASEYGWAKNDILDTVYFDELMLLTAKIKKRKYSEYRVQLLIAQNPHTQKPQDLWDLLQDGDEMPHNDIALDREGLKNLKEMMSKGRAVQVK